MNAFVFIVIVILSLLLVLRAVRLINGKSAKQGVRAELCRKLVHIIMGSLCLSFPWIFQSALPVCILAVSIFALLFWLKQRRSPLVQDVLFTVQRKSCGELLFPIAVAITFALYKWQGEPALYLVPIAVLTYSDAAAALIGEHFGKVRLRLSRGSKTLEGSLAFFLVSFLAATAILSFTPAGIFTALIVSTISTFTEAICSGGLDNLLVPLSVFAVLEAASIFPGVLSLI